MQTVRDRGYFRYKKENHKKRLAWLSNITHHPQLTKKVYDEITSEFLYYKRLYRDNHKGGRYRFYKILANRYVRRYRGLIANKGGYKKVYDFWWEAD